MNKSFKFLYNSFLFSNLADGFNLILFPIIASKITDSASLIGICAAARSLPWLLLSIHSGVIIDSFDRVKILKINNLIRSVLFIILFFTLFTNILNIYALIILSFLVGCSEVFYDNTSCSIIPSLVDKKNLEKANGQILSLEILMNRFIGCTVGAYIIGHLTFANSSILVFSFYLISFLLLLKIRIPKTEKIQKNEKKDTMSNQIFNGFKVIKTTPLLLIFMICSAIGNFSYYAFESILVLFIKNDLQISSWYLGVSISSLGLGSFLCGRYGHLLIDKFKRNNIYGLSSLFIPISFFLIYYFKNKYSLILSLFLLGILFTLTRLISASYRQRSVENKNLGKVNSIYRLASWGTQPLGALFAGAFASSYSVISTYFLITGISSLIFITFLLSFKNKSNNILDSNERLNLKEN